MEQSQKEEKYQVSAFYQFIPIENPNGLKGILEDHLNETTILGTVLVAEEGINGTISGNSDEVSNFFVFLADQLGVASVPYKKAENNTRPFLRMKVRLKKEIVTLGVDGIDPTSEVGTYVAPKDWNGLISREDVLLVDTRNEYELAVGTFKGAKNPHTESFREFPDYVDNNLNPLKTPKVAMFCTGGIRCEKATALMLKKGYKEVFHLEGGILEYFNQVPEKDSLWEGECFVFDERVTVDQNLNKGSYEMCHACRMPLSETDRLAVSYVEGISCPHCIDKIDDDKRVRLAERQRQVKLARRRNRKHIGDTQKRHVTVKSDSAT